jgi:uncharacterized protein YjbI with pentapeptide repeats
VTKVVSSSRKQVRPIRLTTVIAAVLPAIALSAIAMTLLLAVANRSTGDRTSARIEAIKVGLTVAAGTIGLAGLLLAVRRQWLSERAQIHVEDDAAEKRFTDIYAKAVEHLGSERAEVRLGGLYALDRLCASYPTYRQAVINIICGYLRMPFDPLPRRDPDELFEESRWRAKAAMDSEDSTETLGRKREVEVRLTAQQILANRLRRRSEMSFASQGPTEFAPLDIDLRGATLIDFDLSSCTVNSGHFEGARFVGMTFIENSVFRRQAHFDLARFEKLVYFTNSRFENGAWFDGVNFAAPAWMNDIHFGDHVRFPRARFGDYAFFGGSTFEGMAWFEGARFEASLSFEGAIIENRGKNSIDRFDLSQVMIFGAEHARRAELPPGWTVERVAFSARGRVYSAIQTPATT